jgi:hypothetical protein
VSVIEFNGLLINSIIITIETLKFNRKKDLTGILETSDVEAEAYVEAPETVAFWWKRLKICRYVSNLLFKFW